jgi:hypothetical protein
MYGLEPNVRPECDRKTLFSLALPYLIFLCYRVALVEIELMIDLFLVFKVIESQGNYMKEFYDPSEYKLR